VPTPPLHSRTVERADVHYAWVILLVGTLGLMMTIPGQTVGVSVFLDNIIDDLGASRASVALLYTLGTLAGALALPFVGRAIDHFGPRSAVGPIAAGLALAALFMAFVDSLPLLAIGFVLLRGFGQGALALVSLHVINIWFVNRRGLAVGVTGVGFAIATAAFPWLIETLIGAYGWRTSFALLGALVAMTILPLGILFYRGRPELYGLTPDGGLMQQGQLVARVLEPAFSAAEAQRTPTFWLLATAVATISALSTALVFHHYDLMATRGIDRATATSAFAYLAWLSASSNLFIGALSDRLGTRFAVVLMLLLQTASLLMASVVTPATLPLYAGLLGATMGVSGNVSGTAFARYFGRRAIGAIKGTAQTLSVGGAAAGPVLLSLAPTYLGDYGAGLWLLAFPPLLLAVASAAALTTPRTPPA
jgi:MFS family permease